MNILHFLSSLVILHPILVTYVGSFFSEDMAIFLSVLAGRGMISFFITFFVSILGVLSFDIICFSIGRSRFGKYLEERYLKKHFEKLKGVSHERALFYLIITKFITGTRIATYIYYGMKKLDFEKFLLYNTISVLIWAGIMLPIGWMAGKGVDKYLRIAHGFERFTLIVVITMVIIFVLHKLITKIIFKEAKYLK